MAKKDKFFRCRNLIEYKNLNFGFIGVKFARECGSVGNWGESGICFLCLKQHDKRNPSKNKRSKAGSVL